MLIGVCLAFVLVSSHLCTPASGAENQDVTKEDASSIMRLVAANYAIEVLGVVGVRSHKELTISGPMLQRHTSDDAWYVFQNGALVASSHKADPRQPPLREPYRSEFLGEYSFHLTGKPPRESGTTSIAFESLTHDAVHAHGTLVVDDATGHIMTFTETPYAFVWPTKSGQFDVAWGGSGSDWYPQHIDGAFMGSVGPFVGHAQYVETLSSYEHYSNVDTATSALMRATGEPSVDLDTPAPQPQPQPEPH
jgi:hypothetical protein